MLIRAKGSLGWALCLVVAAELLSSGFPVDSQAEWYVAGQVGYAMIRDPRNTPVTGEQAVTSIPNGTISSRLDFDNSLMFGAKVGYYFETLPWLGVETEVFTSSPNLKQQVVTDRAPGVGTFQYNQPGAHIQATTVAANLVARYQMGAFEPYVGVGPGIFFIRSSHPSYGTGMSGYVDADVRPGLNTQLGLRYRLTEHVALFGEWKVNYTRFHLEPRGPYGGVNANYLVNIFAFGVGYHF